MEEVIIFKNNDLNNLLNDYCQVHNIVKVNEKCPIIKFHKEVYNYYKLHGYNYYLMFFVVNKNIPTCRHYIRSYIKDIHQYNELAFQNSCYNGHIEVVKFLWSLKQGINIHTDNELAFRESCYNGHLEVVKFLWSLNQGINIHVDNEHAFRLSCMNGNIEVVKFLWSLNQGIDIHINNEFAFIWSCYGGHLEVVKFLITLYKQENNTNYLEILNQYPNIKSKIITLP